MKRRDLKLHMRVVDKRNGRKMRVVNTKPVRPVTLPGFGGQGCITVYMADEEAAKSRLVAVEWRDESGKIRTSTVLLRHLEPATKEE